MFARAVVAGVPLIVSLTRVGLHAVVDATHEEEAHMSAALSVAVDGKGLVRSVGKRGGGGASTPRPRPTYRVTVSSHCTSVPVHTRCILFLGLATRSLFSSA